MSTEKDVLRRSDGGHEKVKANRRNRYRMARIDDGDWPGWMRKIRMFSGALYESGRKNAAYDATGLLRSLAPCETGNIGLITWNLIARPPQREMYLYDGSDGRFREMKLSHQAERVACMTQDGFPVIQCFEESGVGVRYLLCLNVDGSERWSFKPELSMDQFIQTFPTAPEGEMILLLKNMQSRNTALLRIDREDGRLLSQTAFDETEFVTHAEWMEQMNCFVLYSLGRNELWIYDKNMQPLRQIALGKKLMRFDYAARYTGCLAVKIDLEQNMNVVNLITGGMRSIQLEVPAYFPWYMEDGRIIAQSKSGKTVIFFDETGKVISRNRFANPVQRIFEEAGRIYFVTCFQYEDAIVRDVSEVIDSVEVWRAEEPRR